MRTKTSQWFETKIKYEKTMEDGLQKPVIELYVVEAQSFTEAEANIIEQASAYISGEYQVKDIKRAQYKEVFFTEEGEGNADTHFYKAKLQFITIDEKTEKEKRQSVFYLVQATSLRNALDNIDKVMASSMADYVQANVGETSIEDVYEYSK